MPIKTGLNAIKKAPEILQGLFYDILRLVKRLR